MKPLRNTLVFASALAFAACAIAQTAVEIQKNPAADNAQTAKASELAMKTVVVKSQLEAAGVALALPEDVILAETGKLANIVVYSKSMDEARLVAALKSIFPDRGYGIATDEERKMVDEKTWQAAQERMLEAGKTMLHDEMLSAVVTRTPTKIAKETASSDERQKTATNSGVGTSG